MRALKHWKQRAALTLLLLVAGTVELRFAWTTLRYVASPRSFPQEPARVDAESFRLSNLEPFAKNAGMKDGDVLVAIDGAPVHSLIEAGRTFYTHAPGEHMVFRLRRGTAAPFDVPFTIAPRNEDDWQTYVIPPVVNILTPLCCTILGFLVAFRRPSDPVARALFGLLFGLSFMFSANASFRYAYSTVLTATSIFLDGFAGSFWVPMWLLFALLFPDPKSRYRLLPRLAWVLAIPYFLLCLIYGVVAVTVMYGLSTPRWLQLAADLPRWLIEAWGTSMIALGFANLVYKLVKETDPCKRRRLKWVMFGLGLGLGPVTLLLLSSTLLRKDLNTYPSWALLPGLFSPLLVPLTLGYAVLVDRAFDIGMGIRQGLLAFWTTILASFLLMAVFSWETYLYVSRRDITDVQRALGVGVALTGILLMNRALDWLRGWVDRRFFREAVNAENVLTELSTEVRRITDPQLLLRTVSERIAGALHIERVVALLPEGGAFVPAYCFGGDGGNSCASYSFEEPVLSSIRHKSDPVLVGGQRDRNGEVGREQGGALVELGTELLLPLSTNGELHGVLSLGPKRSEEPYCRRDIRLLESVANQTALALEVSRLTSAMAVEAEQRVRLGNEIEIARQVQQRLFPKCAPDVAGVELCGHCRPAETIGGDYYDFLTTPSGELGLAIGDVAGKGVPAALLMAGLQASLRSLTLAGISDLSELMAKLNVLVYDATPANRFATFFYGLYDPSTRRLRYSTAGHNPGLLQRASDGEIRWLKTRGVGLGLQRSSTYEQAELTLEPGDRLILYTDGVTEARNAEGEEFGVDRLAAAVCCCTNPSASAILNRVIEATTEFAGDAPQFDDITMIVARVV